jgi:hypothetical protein
VHSAFVATFRDFLPHVSFLRRPSPHLRAPRSVPGRLIFSSSGVGVNKLPSFTSLTKKAPRYENLRRRNEVKMQTSDFEVSEGACRGEGR